MGNKQSTHVEEKHFDKAMVSIHDELERKLQDSDSTPMVFPLEFLKTITHDFSSAILGKGGFGEVYKGYLQCGKIIAVKRLNTPHLIAEMFEKEVQNFTVMRKHPNVVQFLGYCAESIPTMVIVHGKPIVADRLERLMCFEYIPNKSLDKHISAETLGLDWDTRYNIIKGICNGLHFLHAGRYRIHQDLKPQNILMDFTMRPKIMYFGLSRMFGEEQTPIITKICPETRGYMAKEYIYEGVDTQMVDIFSLGVIVIEIITGSREYSYFQDGSPQDISTSLQEFKEKVIGSWMNRILSTSKFASAVNYMQQVELCITIALKCVDVCRFKRPKIKDIIQKLNAVDQEPLSSVNTGVQSTAMIIVRAELERKLQNSDATPMVLPLEFLKTITRDFSSAIVGIGGFGMVYKGYLHCGTIIAVKRLNTPHLIAEMFGNEVRHLTMMRKHPNVVRYVGYCDESIPGVFIINGKPIAAATLEKMLCFEYVPNKSLDEHISAESLGLEWDTRFRIIKGICNGLRFLHEECRIVHLDLKPQNILMDYSMRPKIADFGISRIFGEDQTRTITKNSRGTRAYMAKEYIDRGVITKKADIFSLGVICIEIITGGREYPDFLQGSPSVIAPSLQEFKDKVLGNWRKRILSSPISRSVEYYLLQVEQCITIALKCVDCRMEKRPTAEDIIRMLNVLDQIMVKTLAGNTITLEVLSSDTIEDVKAMIQHKGGATRVKDHIQHTEYSSACKFRCIFAGRQLTEEQTVAHYNIQNGSTIHVRLCNSSYQVPEISY